MFDTWGPDDTRTGLHAEIKPDGMVLRTLAPLVSARPFRNTKETVVALSALEEMSGNLNAGHLNLHTHWHLHNEYEPEYLSLYQRVTAHGSHNRLSAHADQWDALGTWLAGVVVDLDRYLIKIPTKMTPSAAGMSLPEQMRRQRLALA